jgi:DNA integrity scanning protein DisA with diadenylate cyclase activity
MFFHDKIIRPYIGDVLVIILLFCFCKIFINGHAFKIALAVLLFAYLVEMLQYFHLLNLLHLRSSGVAGVVLGHSFDWADILCYTVGIIIVLITEKLKSFIKR